MTNKFFVVIAVIGLLVASCGTETGSEAGIEAGAPDDAVTSSVLGSEPAPTSDAAAGSGRGSEPVATANAASSSLFARTLSEAATVNSARFEGRFSVAGYDEANPELSAEMVMSGGFDLSAEAMELRVDMGDLFAAGLAASNEEIPPGFDGFFTEPMQLIVIGDQSWLNWSFLSIFTGQEDVWMELDSTEVDGATESFGFSSGAANPTELLDSLAAADAQLEDLGVETIRGVETRHWRALMDLEGLTGELSDQERVELEDQLGGLDTTAYPMDLWIGVDDELLYRYEISVVGDGFIDDEATPFSAASLSFELFDYGADIDIIPPPADQILPADGLFGS